MLNSIHAEILRSAIILCENKAIEKNFNMMKGMKELPLITTKRIAGQYEKLQHSVSGGNDS